jgi:hypothetical protein
MERTEGDQQFHEVKLGRDLDLHSRSREAFAKQIAENIKKPNHLFYSQHGIEPVVQHLERKIKKHHRNVKDLTFLRKLPGPQTLTDLADKFKLPHTYED